MIFGHTVKNSPQRKWVSDPTKSFMYRCTNSLCLPLEAALLIRCEFFCATPSQSRSTQTQNTVYPRSKRLATMDQAKLKQYCPYLTRFMKFLHNRDDYTIDSVFSNEQLAVITPKHIIRMDRPVREQLLAVHSSICSLRHAQLEVRKLLDQHRAERNRLFHIVNSNIRRIAMVPTRHANPAQNVVNNNPVPQDNGYSKKSSTRRL